MWFDTTAETYGEELTTYSDFAVAPGDRIAFTLSWEPSHKQPPALPEPEQSLEATEDFWREWVEHCTYHGPYREAVIRSLITLKALTYAPTGGIVAAPTTSLPEDIGGVRNWDYRYTWLRDAAITLSSLLRTGYREEARAWREWLLRAVAGDPENLQIMYGIAGERELGEAELDWLPGYEASAPVRVGNGAAHQLQLDVYGEVTEALHLAHMTGLARNDYASLLQLKLIRYLEKHWQEPDEGIWEVRGPRRHFVHSKVMAWVAVDRTIKLIESGDAEGPLEEWKQLRDDIHRDVCEKGYDKERNTFTQSYGSKELDAALLLIPQVGFLPPDDKRVIGTVEAIQRELSTSDGFILRYPTEGHGRGRRRPARRRGRVPRLLVLDGRRPGHDRPGGRGAEAVREAAGAAQRPRPAGGGVGPAPPAPGRQLPAGVQPCAAHRHGPAADGVGGVRRLTAPPRPRPARRRGADPFTQAGRVTRTRPPGTVRCMSTRRRHTPAHRHHRAARPGVARAARRPPRGRRLRGAAGAHGALGARGRGAPTSPPCSRAASCC
ncbi:hypothetical protein GCM10019016_041440 [Streptomyces prasinosporus]|uniref:GH15-like domain-containing protein n=1 Tax=Streptomyces prasinosporus TaxID=68256 RepID=A0ABP6TP26_9ACTN